jgi:tetratricopeptide (TPR) repeat protein
MGNSINYRTALSSLLAMLLCLVGHAQQLPITNEAARLCQQLQLDAALVKSNESLNDKTESADAYAWYVNGFVLKEIYKDREYGLRNSSLRTAAMKSFATSMDKKNAQQHLAMTRLAMKYLASTYYNDALQAAQSIAEGGEQEANALFVQFEKWMPLAEPGISMTGYKKEFTKSIGQRYFSLWQRDTDNSENRDKAVAQYEKILKLDSSDVDAYYNLSVIHYNQAVFMYRKINHETDLFDMMTIQEAAAKLIREKALPLMDKAYALSPEKGEVVHGKIILHRALDHEKDVEYFKNEITRLISEGKIKAEQQK